MNPNPTLPQQNQSQGQQQSFMPHHNQVYDMLRNTLMDLHSKGVPGMDKVLNALNSTHVQQVKPQQPHMPGQQPQGNLLNRSAPGLMQDIQGLAGKPIIGSSQPQGKAVLGAETMALPPQAMAQAASAISGGAMDKVGSIAEGMSKYPGLSLDNYADLVRNWPIGFSKWLDAQGLNHTQLDTSQITPLLDKFMSMGAPAAGAAGSVMLDAIMPLIMPTKPFGDLMNQLRLPNQQQQT